MLVYWNVRRTLFVRCKCILSALKPAQRSTQAAFTYNTRRTAILLSVCALNLRGRRGGINIAVWSRCSQCLTDGSTCRRTCVIGLTNTSDNERKYMVLITQIYHDARFTENAAGSYGIVKRCTYHLRKEVKNGNKALIRKVCVFFDYVA